MENEVVKREAEHVQERPVVAPRVDVYENADEVLLIADLPGVSKDAIRIDLQDGELTIEGTRSVRTGGERIQHEYRAWDFRRSFKLPQGLDYNKVDARMKAGVLELHLPKAAAVKPRKIEVRAG